jgi:hypothetical protein
MSALNKLASVLGRRDEAPNIALARQLVDANDQDGIRELVEGLHHKKKDIQSDCIKVLYEAGERKPELLADHLNVFVSLLESNNNRLQWGSMAAISAIARKKPDLIYKVLPKIIAAADKGTVITRDEAVRILITLIKEKKYSETAFALVLEQILKSPPNQVPMYAEMALPEVNEKNKSNFVKALSSRLADIEKDTKKKRVETVIRKLSKP